MDSTGHPTDVEGQQVLRGPPNTPPRLSHQLKSEGSDKGDPLGSESDEEVDDTDQELGERDEADRELFNNEDDLQEKINWSNEDDQRGDNGIVESDFVEDFPVSEEQMTISVKRIPVAPPKDDTLWMLGLPATVTLDKQIFNKEASEKRENEAQMNETKLRLLKQSLTSCTIRSAKDSGAAHQSNTRLFEFSDGSSALIIGRKQLEAGPREKDGLNMFLLEMSDNPICHIHGHLETKKLFSAPNVMELRGLMDNPLSATSTGGQASALKTRITTVQHGAESELRLKRHMEEQLIKELDSTNKAVKKKKTATLDANFLERDD